MTTSTSTSTSTASPRRRAARSALAFAAVALAAALCASGCQAYRMATPPSFARVSHADSGHGFRAVSAFGVALALRVEANEAQGNLDFWSEAIRRHLLASSEYRTTGTAEVHTASGLAGRQLQFAFGDARAESTYVLTVFVTAARVYVIEAGGPADAFALARPEIDRAIASFSGV